MPCPLCNNIDTRVTRTTERDNGTVRRTRQCCRCGHRWATLEIHEADAERAERVRAAAGALMSAIGNGA